MMAKQESKKKREPQNLHERYGKIGISAVAAALVFQGNAKKVFQGNAKNPVYAPVTPATTSGTTKLRDQRSAPSLAALGIIHSPSKS
jgi:hypothetical protein